jgi:NDP-sugar pyrophosphorylase family protein
LFPDRRAPSEPGASRPTIKSIYEPNNKRFNVIILAAGSGSRLRARTGELPKALIEIDGARAIDLLIRKYRFVTDRLILSTGYNAELLEYYVKGKYPDLEMVFSREPVQELAGPGRSFLRALDRASSFLPTLSCFCDILIGDGFDVSSDALLVCNPEFVSAGSVVDRYSNVAQIEEGLVSDLLPSAKAKGNRNGFTGTAVFHNTMLLKKVCYEAALQGRDEYTLDFVRGYARQARMKALYTAEIFEFGTMESLTALMGAGGASDG